MTFEDWLLTQKNRNTPLGDLSRDFIRDGCPVPFTQEYLKYRGGVCRDAKVTYKKAQLSYKNFLNRQKRLLTVSGDNSVCNHV
jgi:hypothetical protein